MPVVHWPRAALVALAVALAVAACSSGNSKTATATSSTVPVPSSSTPSSASGEVIEITVSAGKVDGGVQRKKVKLGSDVILRVHSDVADEVHLHGYDKKADVAAGGTAEIDFTADIPGVFEAELESAGIKLVELEIS